MTTLVRVGLPPGPVERREPALAEYVAPFLGWFASVRGRAENTILAYHRDLRSFIGFAEAHGVRLPRQVTFQVLEAYLAWLTRKQGRRATTANRHRYALNQFFRYLRRQGVVVNNPVEDTFELKTPKRLPRYLTIPEQEMLLDHLAASESLSGKRDHVLVATALLTGLRVAELVSLRLDQLQLEAGRLRVVGKGDKEREVPIIPRLRAILEDYLAHVRPRLASAPVRGRIARRKGRRTWSMVIDRRLESTGTRDEAEARAILADRVRDLRYERQSPYVFVNASRSGVHTRRRAGQPLLTRSIFAMLRRRASAIVGQPVSPHQLRHSCASRMREHGAPLELIQDMLGHENISTTLIYAHLTTKKRQEDIARYLDGEEGAAR